MLRSDSGVAYASDRQDTMHTRAEDARCACSTARTVLGSANALDGEWGPSPRQGCPRNMRLRKSALTGVVQHYDSPVPLTDANRSLSDLATSILGSRLAGCHLFVCLKPRESMASLERSNRTSYIIAAWHRAHERLQMPSSRLHANSLASWQGLIRGVAKELA